MDVLHKHLCLLCFISFVLFHFMPLFFYVAVRFLFLHKNICIILICRTLLWVIIPQHGGCLLINLIVNIFFFKLCECWFVFRTSKKLYCLKQENGRWTKSLRLWDSVCIAYNSKWSYLPWVGISHRQLPLTSSCMDVLSRSCNE